MKQVSSLSFFCFIYCAYLHRTLSLSFFFLPGAYCVPEKSTAISLLFLFTSIHSFTMLFFLACCSNVFYTVIKKMLKDFARVKEKFCFAWNHIKFLHHLNDLNYDGAETRATKWDNNWANERWCFWQLFFSSQWFSTAHYRWKFVIDLFIVLKYLCDKNTKWLMMLAY